MEKYLCMLSKKNTHEKWSVNNKNKYFYLGNVRKFYIYNKNEINMLKRFYIKNELSYRWI